MFKFKFIYVLLIVDRFVYFWFAENILLRENMFWKKKPPIEKLKLKAKGEG